MDNLLSEAALAAWTNGLCSGRATRRISIKTWAAIAATSVNAGVARADRRCVLYWHARNYGFSQERAET